MLEIYHSSSNSNPRPYVSYPFACGEALENESPVEWLSLDDYVSGNSDSVLYVRVRGESMLGVGIDTGDLLVIDRTKQAENGAIVLARIGRTYTIKKFIEINAYEKRRKFYLVPANPKFQPKRLQKKDDFEIIGVMTHLIKRFY